MDKLIATNLRLPADYYQKIRKLREAGFLPAAIMRKACMRAIDDALEKAREWE